jgi:hypothetical protein
MVLIHWLRIYQNSAVKMGDAQLLKDYFPGKTLDYQLRQVFSSTNSDRSHTTSDYVGFTKWMKGKKPQPPTSIRDKVNTFIETFVRPNFQDVDAAIDDDEEGVGHNEEQIAVLAQRLGELRIDSESYVYVYYDIRFACFETELPTKENFAKGIIYIGKGVGERYLHKVSALSDIDDKLVDIRDGLPKPNGRVIWTVKFPFVGLSDDQAKFIEYKLISYSCTVGKHLWTDGCCNENTVQKRWGKKCLANRYNGNRRVSLAVNDHFAEMTGEELFNTVLEFFYRRVFMMM